MTHLAPPKGYTNWLDYAVATMDVRSAQQAATGFFDNGTCFKYDIPSYDDIRAAAKAELTELQKGLLHDTTDFDGC